MKIIIVLCGLIAITVAKPANLFAAPVALAAAPVAYAAAPLALTKLVPGAPIGLDGRVVDTPEVSYAKAEHAAAHLNEKLNLAKEAVKSADVIAYAAASPAIVSSAPVVAPVPIAKLQTGAPIGLDGRVVDTPEVAFAKAEHAAAHFNAKIEQGHEYLRNSFYSPSPIILSPYSAPAYATGFIQHYY